MRASYDPNQRYSDLFWVLPGGRAFMAVGLHGQLIAVFPDLDVVAVVTARKFVSFFALIEGIYEAAKSDSALPPDPRAAELLANAVKDAAVEKSSPVGPTPEIASTISGRPYKFAQNGLGLRSLTLFLSNPRPYVEFEIDAQSASRPLIKYEAPIGLDGLYREGAPGVSGDQMRRILISKGTWFQRAHVRHRVPGLRCRMPGVRQPIHRCRAAQRTWPATRAPFRCAATGTESDLTSKASA
jgi:hypothetical protein